MNVYEFSPQKSNKKALGIILILLSLSAGLFAFTTLFPDIPYRWALQLISVMSFVVIIFIISRYIAKSFLYAVVKNDDTLDFTVTEITNAGRTHITVCRIALSNIEEAHLIDRSIPENIEKLKNIKKTANTDGRKSFNYCPDVNPTEFCILLIEECGEKILLKLSYDPTLWRYFNNK